MNSVQIRKSIAVIYKMCRQNSRYVKITLAKNSMLLNEFNNTYVLLYFPLANSKRGAAMRAAGTARGNQR
jgi:hypothetical protein